MGLAAWWMLVLWGVVGLASLAGVVIMRKTRQSKPRDASAVPVAHSDRLISLPAYQALMKKYRLLVGILAACMVLLVLTGVLLSARPVAVTVDRPEVYSRDIVLCLDISGSMRETNQGILLSYSDIVKELQGERIALTVFDGSSSTVFPLTDDYDHIEDSLEVVLEGIMSFDSGLFAGTTQAEGSSRVGDGLTSCLMRFDNQDIERSRSIILATDNYVAGPQVVTLPQAAALAKERSVRVYGVNPNDASNDFFIDDRAKEFYDAMVNTGGGYYKIGFGESANPAVIKGIVDKITEQEATRFKGAPQIIKSDVPAGFIVASLVLVLAASVISWRIGR